MDRVTDLSPPAGGVALTDDLKHERKVLVDAINEAELKEALRTYATTEIPYGLWDKKPGCDKLAAQPKAGDFTGAARPTWMNKVNPPADAPVYMAAPGAVIYAHVCVNCHGPKADGKGLQADALAASSEGEARPANFREGLFGPSPDPGANLLSAFGMGNANVASAWAPRYMAWMALGGTLKRIPQDIIHQVEATKVFGQQRPNLHHLLGAENASANMLKLAAGLCAVILPDKSSGHYYHYAAFETAASRSSTRRSTRTTRPSWTRSLTATCGSTSARNTVRLSSASTACRALLLRTHKPVVPRKAMSTSWRSTTVTATRPTRRFSTRTR